MQWDATDHAGFTDGDPWLPVNPNHVTINVEAAVADPDSVFHHYRRLVELRHRERTVVDGRFDLLLPEHDQLWAFTRSADDDVLLVVANCSSRPVPATDETTSALPDLTGATLLVGTHGDGQDLDLEPWESRVYRLR
jgi:oligo-1,6-glucosidase